MGLKILNTKLKWSKIVGKKWSSSTWSKIFLGNHHLGVLILLEIPNPFVNSLYCLMAEG